MKPTLPAAKDHSMTYFLQKDMSRNEDILDEVPLFLAVKLLRFCETLFLMTVSFDFLLDLLFTLIRDFRFLFPSPSQSSSSSSSKLSSRPDDDSLSIGLGIRL